MVKPGYLVYKCRKCEREIANMHVPQALIAMLSVTSNVPATPKIDEKITHYCEDGVLGICDLVGAIETEEYRQ